ncbi:MULTISPECIES: phosphoribosylaminoimidazolesuccinocarboxamide synthase [Rossellomorea]|uniref:phosphoribosylaminoimidazolesuccinocarboxamide synthase n=1 Tax=Rossellomorea TaxID=2837508 RepID=UPI001CC9D9F3|nr:MULTISPECIES: phosphoribosylaminoimidazolesuccinocarboxamide synthase [Rossellomorea]MCA0150214.1 phosphoribosylaminoimidazolesuccinocarboxamide synthase [Rossellomorea vietnamensis]UTE78017.1 phosphoribosylaminoimidazolesuccinocarboxamide synthase [Rossellomorea sp. KS-H15a]WGG45976.1 phosphoribosylaminoimidazolesuccinocarboxamide synthase [Rossellomorea sp. DA94]
MEKGTLLYEGKAKQIFETNDEDVVWIQYKNSATAFNGEKKADIDGKGVLNNKISSLLFSKLAEKGIQSHFIKQISEDEQLVKRVRIIPLEVVVRNVIAGSLSKRLGKEEGTPLQKPIIEFYYKDDDLGDPLITDDHIDFLEIASREERAEIREMALGVNEVLQEIFREAGVTLVDFKLEFGKDRNGTILLGDEISPDTCRLWDAETNQKLDKDVFRRDIGSLTEVYSIILERLGGNKLCTK